MFSHLNARSLTTPGLVLELSESVGELEAIVADDGRATFGELAGLASRLAVALQDVGVKPNDRVGVFLPNGLRWVVAAMATHIVGASVVPLNTFYRQSELAGAVRRSRMRVLIAERSIFGHDVEADVNALDLATPSSDFAGTFFWDTGETSPTGLPLAPPAEGSALLQASPVTEESEAFLMFTSGSTADPKAVPLLHAPLIRNGFAMGERQHIVPGDRLWIASPFFFGYGCSNALPVALTHATAICMQERFEPSEALAFIERERCTVYYGLPPLTRAIIECPAFGNHDLSSLRTGSTGGGREDRRLTIEVLGVKGICSSYGLTEGYGHTTMTDANDPLDIVLGSVGTVLPTSEIRAMGPNGRPSPVGEVGELQIRGCVTRGYVDAPELNAEAFTEDGWFRTGDLVLFNEEGRMRFRGRIKEIMKVKGVNVSPVEVEAAIRQHPDVDQVFVFGVTDTRAGELVGCAIVRSDRRVDGADEFRSELGSWMRDRVASYKIPSFLELFTNEDLPLTATGKVSKRLLRDQFEADQRP